LFVSGWKFYVALWSSPLAYDFAHLRHPQPLSTSWVAERAVKQLSLLEILIPSDPFTALARNYVPAVVLFCLCMAWRSSRPRKGASAFCSRRIRLASLKFWNAVVRFAPLAVFALFADLAVPCDRKTWKK
jgi:Na+/H+-dicarboxylate symporter